MTGTEAGDIDNRLTGGTQVGPVIQARNVLNPTFNTVQAAAAPVALAQLPAPVAGFTGRETELAEITSLLDPAARTGAVVVSALAGLAGVGKTALAIQAAHAAQAKGWFPGGVLFLDLHGYDDQAVQPSQALDALLRAMGILAEHIPPSLDERAGLYRSTLAAIDHPVLIVADNASAEAQVQPLLPGINRHRLLVTSRHTLAALGARLLDVETLGRQSAIALVEKSLRTARLGDDRIINDTYAAQQLVTVCAGLPLALRITAALLAADPTLTVAELAGQLADEIDRLDTLRYDDGGGTSAPSVAAAFDLSYRRLDEASAKLFRLLPVDTGPDISAAAAVALGGQPASQTRPILGRLVRAHLVEPAGTGAARWRMHDLLRRYARQLPATQTQIEELEQARDRLLNYYLNGASAADAYVRALPDIPDPNPFTSLQQALAWLDSERPNLIAAATMAAITGRDYLALRLPLDLCEYLDWRRRFDDKVAVLGITRDTARRLNDHSNEAAALTNAGAALVEVGRVDEAITAHQGAAEIFQKIGNRIGEGMALNNLGLALRQIRRFSQAITAFQDAASIARDIGNRGGEGMAMNNLGIALQQAQRTAEAITACQHAAAIYRQIGNRGGEGMALNNLGVALRHVRRFDQAITAHQDAAAIARDIGNRHREGSALQNLGFALEEVRRFAEAITAYKDAVAIFRETGDQHREGLALNNLGTALREVRRFAEAITAYHDAAAIFRETGDRRGEDEAVNNAAQVQAAKAEADSET